MTFIGRRKTAITNNSNTRLFDLPVPEARSLQSGAVKGPLRCANRPSFGNVIVECCFLRGSVILVYMMHVLRCVVQTGFCNSLSCILRDREGKRVWLAISFEWLNWPLRHAATRPTPLLI